MNSIRNILVIRNDKLGDFMLAWPSFALLKKQYPQCKLTVLIPEYTRPIAEQCRWIDQIIIDQRHPSFIHDVKQLTALISKHKFDASISLFSELRISIALWLARVPYRLAPATKIAQVFYTHRLRQKRSSSHKPEFEYNTELVKHYICNNGDTPVITPAAPYLFYAADEILRIKIEYLSGNKISDKSILVIIHPGSGGSAINLSIEKYAELAAHISNHLNAHFIITAGPDELADATNLSKLLTTVPHSIYHSTKGLHEFSRFINISDLFISGSTGPLHIAGALNIPTAAFYPDKQSATALRWQTTNDKAIRLAYTLSQQSGSKDMNTIDIKKCAREITELLKSTKNLSN